MTNFSNKLKKPCFSPFFPIFFGKKICQKIRLCHAQLHMGFQHHAKFQKKLIIQSQEKVWAEGRTEGQTDRRMNRPYFIGPFGLLGRSPTSIYQITLRRLCSQILSSYFSSFISKDNHVLVEKHNPLEKSYDSQERTRWY